MLTLLQTSSQINITCLLLFNVATINFTYTYGICYLHYIFIRQHCQKHIVNKVSYLLISPFTFSEVYFEFLPKSLHIQTCFGSGMNAYNTLTSQRIGCMRGESGGQEGINQRTYRHTHIARRHR